MRSKINHPYSRCRHAPLMLVCSPPLKRKKKKCDRSLAPDVTITFCDSCVYFPAKMGYKKVRVSRETDRGEQSFEEDVKDETFSVRQLNNDLFRKLSRVIKYNSVYRKDNEQSRLGVITLALCLLNMLTNGACCQLRCEASSGQTVNVKLAKYT